MTKQDKIDTRLKAALDALEQKALADSALTDVPARLEASKDTYKQAIAVREEMHQAMKGSVRKSVIGLSSVATMTATAVAGGAAFLLFPWTVAPLVAAAVLTAPISCFYSVVMIGDARMNAAERRHKIHYERFAQVFEKIERQTIDDLKVCNPEIVSPLECYVQIKRHIKSSGLTWQFARTLDRAHQELLKESGEKSFKVAGSNRHNYWS